MFDPYSGNDAKRKRPKSSKLRLFRRLRSLQSPAADPMFFALHTVIAALYIILPPAALLTAAIRARRTRSKAPLTSLAFTAAVGLTLGLALNLVYMTATRGRIVPMQVVLAGYYAAGMLLLL